MNLNEPPMPPTSPPLTLVVLAAGRSTRFGRLKQLTPIGPGGEALLDYALYDGALAGFSRFLLVIQEDLRGDFDAHLRPATAAGLDLSYAYQSLSHPGLVDTPPPGRTRPWGTGHAVLTAAEHIDGPFALCNADDFYGRGAYASLADAMRDAAHHHGPAASPTPALTVGYPLEVTLSESGGVSRGLCQVDEAGALQKLAEGLRMRRAGDRVRGRDMAGRPLDVPLDTPVCTNFFGFPEIPIDKSTVKSPPQSVSNIRSHLRTLFSEFLQSNPGTDSEYYLSEAMNKLIARGLVHCQVLPTDELWLGVTFPGDHAGVAESLRTLVDSKVYPRSLWDSPSSPRRD
ncbi:MAG: NTP transferase domain-containing protein [Gemmatimonadota bacterium]|nr:NTP transferase domain-containing protein [Gemmatimonadota bacterium]MDE2872462.1 NTP transferase domain-containing protein [Gemmatimonadota bacterium]